MRTVESTVYKFDELPEQAKERARQWWRDCETRDFDTEFMFDDFAEIAERLGIDLRQRPVKLMGGGTRYEPAIYYSGFWSQGDGACFEGSYAYRKGSAKAIKDYASTDETLHAIAQGLFDVQARNFYRLEAKVEHRGHYYHSLCTEIDVFDRENNYRELHGDDETVRDLLRDFMHWMYRTLEKEFEWRMADAQVDDSIRANEYEFDDTGAIA